MKPGWRVREIVRHAKAIGHHGLMVAGHVLVWAAARAYNVAREWDYHRDDIDHLTEGLR